MNHPGPALRGEGLRIGVVWSRFNEEIVRELVTACDKQLVELGVAAADIDVVSVPGALEIPLVLQSLALERRGFARRYDALVALGAVVRGETYHFEIVANESARGILDVQLETGVPVANAVLTCDTEEQARKDVAFGIGPFLDYFNKVLPTPLGAGAETVDEMIDAVNAKFGASIRHVDLGAVAARGRYASRPAKEELAAPRVLGLGAVLRDLYGEPGATVP